MEVAHWLKKKLPFMEILDFSGRFKSLRFAIEAGSVEALNA